MVSALYSGTQKYRVAYNDVCGNFGGEYGGGISHYGLSRGRRIDHNRIWFNESYDEGAGIMVAGELTADPNALSTGAGDVRSPQNRIAQNIGNDDGGGIRFLMAGNWPEKVENNEIVNNVSTHEGGGISLNDTSNITIDNNTIAGNITTATAVTSNGQPAAAGISLDRLSDPLQTSLPAGSSTFTNPVLFNNILWDNRAGSYDGQAVTGIGSPGDATPINLWDIGSQATGILALADELDPEQHDFGHVNVEPDQQGRGRPALREVLHADGDRRRAPRVRCLPSDGDPRPDAEPVGLGRPG